ncbi:MAG: copper amine oxidase N-terminal domain-containing protein [Bacillota bacterium]
MKKCLLSLVFAIFLIGSLSTSVMAANPIDITLNGEHLQFDVPPVLENGRVLVPLRTVFEALGATVEWDGTTSTVTAIRGNDTVKLTIGKSTAYKNGVSVELDVPAKVIDGRTLVPVRFVSEAFGERVYWFAEIKTVLIFSQGILTYNLNQLAQMVGETKNQNLESAREVVIKNNGLWRYLLLAKEHWMVNGNILKHDNTDLHNIWFPEGEATRFLARFVNKPSSLDQSPYEQTESPIIDLVAFIDLSGSEPSLVWLAYLGKVNKKGITFEDDPIDLALKAFMEKWQGDGWGYTAVSGDKPILDGSKFQEYRQGPGYWFPLN